jgi:hypothetical protein
MTKKHVVIVALLLIGFAARTEAFLGIGDVVFDPSVYAQAIEQVVSLERQYAQLVLSYQMIRSQYDQMVHNAKRLPVDMDRRYRLVRSPWVTSHPSNTYGTTGAWTLAATTGSDIAMGFRAGSEPLRDYGGAMSDLQADQQGYVKSSYGTVELTDAAISTSLETIGRLRGNAAAVQGALQRLEDDSLSADPDLNTEVGVLNKINAASIAALHSAQDTNAVLITLAEQQSVAAKRTRDAEARAINQHIRFVAEAKPVLIAQSAGASDAMRRWRMP